MPGTFTFGDNFEDTQVLSQTDFSKGPGLGIDDPTQFSMQGASLHFHDSDISLVGIALYGGQTIHLDVDYGIGGIDSINSKLLVIDGSGTRLAVNSSSGGTDVGSTSAADPHLDFTASTAGLYFVAITQKDDGYIDGNYEFRGTGTDGGDFVLNMSFDHLPTLQTGTANDDTIGLSASVRRFDALAGNDYVYAGNVDSCINGGDGEDHLQGYAFANHRDFLNGGNGDDYIDGFGGRDVLFGGHGEDLLYGGDGNDQLLGGFGADRLYGDAGADLLSGAGGSDRLYGDDGNDSLYGGGGRDTLQGGAGRDVLSGGEGIDVASYSDAPGGVRVDLRVSSFQNTQSAGYDQLDSFEDLYGSNFSDILLGTDKANRLEGNDGPDTLRSFDGNDSVYTGDGNDRAFAGAGKDYVYTGRGRDLVHGNNGDDDLSGGDGNDTLYGDAGKDYLDGGAGKDSLIGGAAADRFVFEEPSDSALGSADLIDDFSHAQGDEIDLHYVSSGGLTFIGSSAFSGTPGEVRVHALSSGLQAVDINLDTNSSTIEMRIDVNSATVLVAGDFDL